MNLLLFYLLQLLKAFRLFLNFRNSQLVIGESSKFHYLDHLYYNPKRCKKVQHFQLHSSKPSEEQSFLYYPFHIYPIPLPLSITLLEDYHLMLHYGLKLSHLHFYNANYLLYFLNIVIFISFLRKQHSA